MKFKEKKKDWDENDWKEYNKKCAEK